MIRHACHPPAQPRRGAGPLATADDHDLIAQLLGPAAARLVERAPVARLLDACQDELAALGLTASAIRRLQAAAELARRFQPVTSTPAPLDQPRHLLPHLAELRPEPVEILGLLMLDARLGLIDGFHPVAGGSLMHVSVTAREVFAPAIAHRAAAIVLAHNHPSGAVEPSSDDHLFTRLMAQAGQVLGVRVLDHLIVTRRGYFSFGEGRQL